MGCGKDTPIEWAVTVQFIVVQDVIVSATSAEEAMAKANQGDYGEMCHEQDRQVVEALRAEPNE